MALSTPISRRRVACLIPCHNEALSIGEVVSGIKELNLDIDIIVIDNNCDDGTPQIAQSLGAKIVQETNLGKGFALRRGFLLSNHEVVLMIDGDATYSLKVIPEMIQLIDKGFDMVVATRIADSTNSFPKFHNFGNLIFSKLHNFLLSSNVDDAFSGFRAFNYAFVKSFQSDSRGFDIETDLNNFASIVGARVENVQTSYSERIGNSTSKLRTFRDGQKILMRTLRLAWHWRPSTLLLLPTITLLLTGVFLVQGPLREYFVTGLVPRLPSLISGLVLMLTSLLLILFISISSRMSKMEIGLMRIYFQQLKISKF